jgi:hypothetical protein
MPIYSFLKATPFPDDTKRKTEAAKGIGDNTLGTTDHESAV